MITFAELNISPSLCEVLKHTGITEATPVQEESIPIVRSGRDVIVQAQTGTGKTLAFLLPIFEKIKVNAPAIQALIVTPTRELTIQIAKVASQIGEAVGVNCLAIYGGQDVERQKQKLGRNPHVIIGTPGRLLDHLRRRTIDLSHVNKVVLDEADEMLHMGFVEDVETLLSSVASDRQLMLFSATIPDRIRGLARHYMRSPQQIQIKADHITLDGIKQVVIDTTEDTKLDKLCNMINEYQPYLAMVFCHTKKRVSDVTVALAQRGYLVDELHGDLSQVQRTMVLKRFRTAKLQILVATDIAARGLDIEGVTHVFNYDIPHDADAYIHRIGRTGRAGEKGMAVTLVNARQYEYLRRIEAGIQNRIQKQKLERDGKLKEAKKTEVPATEAAKKKIFVPGKDGEKPRSKYANRKGASHGGTNGRSRRKPAGKLKTNLGHRSKMSKH
ncbi:MAG: DEAD/DEAH box helicase [Selenomonadaceae bacterium]